MINADGEYYVKENDGTSREVQIGVDEVFYNNNWWLINMNTIGEFILQKKTKNGYNIIDLENINLVGCNIK